MAVFFDEHDAAESVWYRAQACAELGKVVEADKGKVLVLAVRLYETTSFERATARELVPDGKAKLLKDSENSLIGLDDETLRFLDDIVGAMRPEGNSN